MSVSWRNIARYFIVTVGVVLLTSLTIDATDTLRGSQSALSILADRALVEGCPVGTVRLSLADGEFCIDQYEVSPARTCLHTQPKTLAHTQQNLIDPNCMPQSVPDVVPWVQVSFHQAKELCARRAMRLPTNQEWYEAALGTPDTAVCNIDGELGAGERWSECRSAREVHNMIGNTWEWVDARVTSGLYGERELPPEGYVAAADLDGVASETGARPNEQFSSDYFWSSESGEYAMLRGGFYKSGSDAGIYAIQAKTEPSFSSNAIGFRCIMRL